MRTERKIERILFLAIIVCSLGWCLSTAMAIWLLLDPPKACAYLEGNIHEQHANRHCMGFVDLCLLDLCWDFKS